MTESEIVNQMNAEEERNKVYFMPKQQKQNVANQRQKSDKLIVLD